MSDPLFERWRDSQGRRCTRLRREATPEEAARFEAKIDRRPLTPADIAATQRVLAILGRTPAGTG